MALGPVIGPALLILLLPAGPQACGHISVGALIVPLGSPVYASCTIPSNCSLHKGDGATQIVWKLEREYRAGDRQWRRPDGTQESTLTIARFNYSEASLFCGVLWAGIPQIMAHVDLRAGYVPFRPSNLSCIMNLTTANLTCQWDPGPETFLPTNFTLKSFRSRDRCRSREKPVPDCIPEAGLRRCTIPRRHLQMYQKMELWVLAQNVLGAAESSHLCIDPADVVKPDPPSLRKALSVMQRPGCLRLDWRGHNATDHVEQVCELRHRTYGAPAWTVVSPFLTHGPRSDPCGFLPFTTYLLQMRCRRREESQGSYWSDWSQGLWVTTAQQAPTGQLDAWWKLTPLSQEMLDIQLLWKPMQVKETHGWILGYRVSRRLQGPAGDTQTLCNTTELGCRFSLPAGVRDVFITAFNAAGDSPPTQVTFWEVRGPPLLGLHTSPRDPHSLWVRWEPPRTATHGYVLEWCPAALPSPLSCNTSWRIERDGSSNQVLLDENIEPFQPYEISVFPLYVGGMGPPQQTQAYSQEKAPSCAPKPQLRNIGESWAELMWEPVPLRLRNGILTHYTIFWTDTHDHVAYSVLNASSRTCILSGLEPGSLYRVHMMASTAAGSVNSTDLTLATVALNEKGMHILFILFCLFFPLLVCITATCFRESKKMKNQLWPNVPDPARSSLRGWLPQSLEEENIQLPNLRDSGPLPISSLTVLEKETEKKPSPWGTMEGAGIPARDPPAPARAYLLQAEPLAARAPPGEAQSCSYMNEVQYAKVMDASSSRGQAKTPAPLYLRSDSSQPLLGNLTPSPKPYENLWFQSGSPSSEGDPGPFSFREAPVSLGGLEEPLADFPLLRGLRLGGADGLGGF
ncbi:granulocyte colony-stimulating factor receptor [Ornithorhynchus anatinus]|uniref:granulocyte colony-stimulating factor receptor n=1 Tax=Ornithorhynchus anatinus TaxID=9258 RepID=UPI0010A7CC2D|nr:granulocyte colony-stimulating factor receptor [Ornithorhynchus anatinus]